MSYTDKKMNDNISKVGKITDGSDHRSCLLIYGYGCYRRCGERIVIMTRVFEQPDLADWGRRTGEMGEGAAAGSFTFSRTGTLGFSIYGERCT